MRPIRSFLVLTLALSILGQAVGAQTPAPPPPPPKPAVVKKPNKLRAMVGKLADSAATTAAGMAADSLLGNKGKSVVNALSGNQPCGQAGIAGVLPPGMPGVPGLPGGTAGTAVVSAAKRALLKKKGETIPAAAAQAAPCPAGAQLTAAQAAALASAQAQAAAAAAMQGALPGAAPSGGVPGIPGGSAMGAMAAMTPIGMAVAAAPLAGQAAKGIKGMFGGKPQDKIAMLRELGKGRLELKNVKFIEGTAELEPGFEATFAAFGEALALAEGTYILHVPAEAGEKGEAPDTALARKRIEKVWAAILVNGVSDQRIIAVGVLSPELNAGRKPPKKGDARVEFIRLPKQP